MTPNWFVAWPVRGADEWIAELEKQAPGGLHFLPPEDLHVTLAFLGRFDEGLLKKISDLIATLPLTEVEITLGEFVALPQPRRFSALAFVVGHGRSALDAQISKWRDRICREAGARLETRASLPHITVARPDRRIGEADRDATLEWLEQFPPKSDTRLKLDKPRIYSWSERGSTNRYRILN